MNINELEELACLLVAKTEARRLMTANAGVTGSGESK